MRRENKTKGMLKFCKNFLSIAKWKGLFLSLLLLAGCEMYKMPTDLGMPTWTTSLYLKVVDKCYNIADEISDKDSTFVLVDGKVTLKKSLDAKEIAFNSPKIEQANTSKQEIGYFSVSKLGSCTLIFRNSVELTTGSSISLPSNLQSLTLNSAGFTKAELADAVVLIECKKSSGEVVLGINYSSLKLKVCDWDGNSKSLNFSSDGRVSASESDKNTWFTLKSSGDSLSGNLVAESNVTFDSLILKIAPNSKDNILASKVELPAGSNSFTSDTFSGTSKVSLGGDYEIYQAKIDTGKIVFSNTVSLTGIKLTGIKVQCSNLKDNDGNTLDTTVLTNETDSIIDLKDYTLGDGEHSLDSLQFNYEVGYAAKSGEAISVKNTDAVEIGAKVVTSFEWVKAKVKSASAFDMDSTNEKIDFGDDLPAFKTAKGVDTTLSLAKNTKLTLGISLPATVTSGSANLMECNLTLRAYKGGEVKKTIDKKENIYVGTTKGAVSNIVVDGLEDLINCSPDSITVKIAPKIVQSNDVFIFYCGDSIKTSINLTSNLIFGEESQIVYYEVEDKPDEQDCPLTTVQAEATEEIAAHIEYKNNTNTSLGAELLISKDSTYLRQNIYTSGVSDDKLRRVNLGDLGYNTNDTTIIKNSSITMSKQDLLMLAGKDDEKVYTFIKVKVTGTGLELKGSFDVKVYVSATVKVDDKLREDNND